MAQINRVAFLRYPGGKQRMLNHLMLFLPKREQIAGRFVEPFVGGGAIFFALNPERAVLADINPGLIDLYRGLRRFPERVWQIFRSFPATKRAYYEIRNDPCQFADPAFRAARLLYLNRTCFKGMWRQNSNGQFNVGYGGQDRRWVVNLSSIAEVAKRLKKAALKNDDFENTVESCSQGDFLFVDPPYLPGEREIINDHYVFHKFNYEDHMRLATVLKSATRKGVGWALTTSSHPDIMRLFKGNRIIHLPKGTGTMPGIMTYKSGEVLILKYREMRS